MEVPELKLPKGLHRKLKPNELPKDDTPCSICRANSFKYTCPRCNMKYCSVPCYQAESHRSCAETFYKQCCLDSLAEIQTNDEDDKEKVMNFLKKDFKEKATDSVEDGPELAERIEGLDLETEEDLEKVWSRLTEKERKEFEACLTNGEAAKWLKADYTAWWELPLIREVGDNTNQKIPNLYKKARRLSELTKQKPSPSLPYNLINILYSYCYICRLYNGDHTETDTVEEACLDLLAISNVLSKNENYSNMQMSLCDAVSSVMENQSLFSTNEFSRHVMEDVETLLMKGMEAVSRALSDTRECLRLSGSRLKKGGDTNAEKRAKETKTVVKKIEFYLGWVVEYGEEHLERLGRGVKMEALAYQKKIDSVKHQAKNDSDDDDDDD